MGPTVGFFNAFQQILRLRRVTPPAWAHRERVATAHALWGGAWVGLTGRSFPGTVETVLWEQVLALWAGPQSHYGREGSVWKHQGTQVSFTFTTMPGLHMCVPFILQRQRWLFLFPDVLSQHPMLRVGKMAEE